MYPKTEIINIGGTSYVVATMLKGDKFVSSVYSLTEDGEYQGFITNDKYAYTEQRAKINHDILVVLYTDKEHIPHNCDFCGKPYAEKSEYLSRKYGKETYLCRTCLDLYVNERG